MFDEFKLPIGGELYIYSDTKKQIIGPYTSKMNPKKETVSFLLSYSKSFCVLETKDFSFELNKN